MRVLAVLIRLEGGGAEASVARIIPPLLRRGVIVQRASCEIAWPGEQSDPSRSLANPYGDNPLGWLRSAWKLRQQVLNFRPDIIHVHCERPELIVAIAKWMHWLGRVPIIVTEHTREPWKQHPIVGRVVRRILTAHSARFVACYTGGKAGISVIYNPANPELPARDLPAALERIVVIGRLNDGKRVSWILNAASRAKVACPIVVTGDGPARRHLSILAGLLALDVTFRGFQKDPWSDVRSGDLFVTASSFEGEPLAVIEAIAARVPALMSRISGHEGLAHSPDQLFSSVEGLVDRLKFAMEPKGLSALIPSLRFRETILSARSPESVADRWVREYDILANES
ncbi:glycosyltransferase [Cryobacterium sp. 10I5]|uniref:glycosyltransferase n=1 Tax=Cryobacterium sp. 10I5 TaxID=3048581 RepID=UPI003A5991C1